MPESTLRRVAIGISAAPKGISGIILSPSEVEASSLSPPQVSLSQLFVPAAVEQLLVPVAVVAVESQLNEDVKAFVAEGAVTLGPMGTIGIASSTEVKAPSLPPRKVSLSQLFALAAVEQLLVLVDVAVEPKLNARTLR